MALIEDSLRMMVNYSRIFFFSLSFASLFIIDLIIYIFDQCLIDYVFRVRIFTFFFLPSDRQHFNHVLMFRFRNFIRVFIVIQRVHWPCRNSKMMNRKKLYDCLFGECIKTIHILLSFVAK